MAFVSVSFDIGIPGSSEFLKVSQDRRHSACPPIGRRPRKRLGMLHPSYSHSPRVSPRHTPKTRYNTERESRLNNQTKVTKFATFHLRRLLS